MGIWTKTDESKRVEDIAIDKDTVSEEYFTFINYMHLSVLPACSYVHHMHD